MTNSTNTAVPVLKDEDQQQPVGTAWRSTLRAVVDAIASGDYTLRRGIAGVPGLPPSTAKQIEEYVADYGETLTSLPDDTWASSVTQWMGDYWDVLVDLWTDESGESDMVLSVRVFEDGDAYRYEVQGVFVP